VLVQMQAVGLPLQRRRQLLLSLLSPSKQRNAHSSGSSGAWLLPSGHNEKGATEGRADGLPVGGDAGLQHSSASQLHPSLSGVQYGSQRSSSWTQPGSFKKSQLFLQLPVSTAPTLPSSQVVGGNPQHSESETTSVRLSNQRHSQ